MVWENESLGSLGELGGVPGIRRDGGITEISIAQRGEGGGQFLSSRG